MVNMATANSSVGVDSAHSERLDSLYRQARLRWPDFEIPFGDFAHHVAERQCESGSASIWEHAADLYLVCACLRGLAPALRAFEREYLEPVLIGSATMPARDDLRQIVLEKLLLPRAGGRRRFEDYSGRSSLRTWIRVVATRVQLNIARGHGPRTTDYVDELSESNLIPLGSDPELDYLRCRYAHEFQQAFREALCSLDTRSTLLLKMHLVEHTSGNEMAARFGVNRVTVVRWMADVRHQLLSVTREHLQRVRKLSRTEFDSVVRVVWKHLNVSLSVLEREPS
jgi:RNA polymerase sigma-70 factor